MYIRIPNLLNEKQLEFIDGVVEEGSFVDGSSTTGIPTKAVKKNLQLDFTNHPLREEFLRLIGQVMNENNLIRSATFPRRMSIPLLSKYEAGMGYGWHVDNGLMLGAGTPLRTDIACTIFLSDSAGYDGGELQVRTSSGEVQIKLERGDAFIYPATSRHQVAEVTRGERLAVVFWIQSMIADGGQREILYDLDLAYDRVLRDNPESEAAPMIQRAQANLLRQWTEV